MRRVERLVRRALERELRLIEGVAWRPEPQEPSTSGDHLLNTFAAVRREVEEIAARFGPDAPSSTAEGILDAIRWFSSVAAPLFVLLDTVVELAEGRFPGARRGAEKRAFVVEAVARLLEKDRHPIFVARLGLDRELLRSLVGLGVDGLVEVLNEREAWDGSSAPTSLSGTLRGLFTRLWLTLMAAVARLLRPPETISPALWAEVERAVVVPFDRLRAALRAGSPDHPGTIAEQLDRFADLGRSFMRIIDLVVDDVEDLVHLTGPEKLAVARDTVLRILSEHFDLPLQRSPLARALATALVEALTNGLVEVLNRRQQLRPHVLHARVRALPERERLPAADLGQSGT